MQNKGREEINYIKTANGLTDKWLSEKTGIDYYTLNRQLTTASNFRQDVYDACMEAFRKNGYVSNNKEHCEKLMQDILEFNSVVSGSVSLLNRATKEKIKDLKLDPQEKKQLREQVEALRNRINDSIDELTITIDLK